MAIVKIGIWDDKLPAGNWALAIGFFSKTDAGKLRSESAVANATHWASVLDGKLLIQPFTSGVSEILSVGGKYYVGTSEPSNTSFWWHHWYLRVDSLTGDLHVQAERPSTLERRFIAVDTNGDWSLTNTEPAVADQAWPLKVAGTDPAEGDIHFWRFQ